MTVCCSFSQQAGEGPIAVILSPTRELCEQIWREVTIFILPITDPLRRLLRTYCYYIIHFWNFRRKDLAKYITSKAWQFSVERQSGPKSKPLKQVHAMCLPIACCLTETNAPVQTFLMLSVCNECSTFLVR